MLPDIRAVIAAIVAAVGLLSAAFGLVATLRVAQQQHSASFQADLAARGRPVLPASATPSAPPGERVVLIVDTPGPHLAPPARSPVPVNAPAEDPAPEPVPPAPAVAVQTLALAPLVVPAAPAVDPPQAAPHAQAPQPRPPAEATQATPPTEAAQATPPSDPPIGGPLLAEPPRSASDNSANRKRAAAEKARKVRAARIARERKAAKRAAQARRAKQPSSPSFGNTNTFGTINQVGGTFRQ
jgi:hypothetical protein